MTGAAVRTEKDLIIATRPFTEEDKGKSWAVTISSLLILAGLAAGAIASPWWLLRLAFSLVEGLTIVRVFCLFHDFQHGALLRQSKLAEAIHWVFGVSILVPPSVWRETHNYHHAHTAKIVGSHVGSYLMVTTEMWAKMSAKERSDYKLLRHPALIFFAYFTVFAIGMCLSPFRRNPSKNWDSLLALVVQALGNALIFGVFG
ncbi:MAG: fatty acid desaturase, partial [Proteobacteria bacterium]|nr:fatty acid desaturase [Pseudomonadota bacterium]